MSSRTQSSDGDREAQKKALIEKFPDPDVNSRQYRNDQRCHDDYENMKNRFGIASMDWERTWTEKQARQHKHAEEGGRVFRKKLMPNVVKHSWDPEDPDLLAGGTDWLTVGPPGAGKSNLALWLSLRLMEANNEKIVWRASTSRSEWLPFAPWARVCLPEGVNVDARFVPKNPTQDGFDVELEDIVREVVRYRDPVHLNHDLMKEGQFHVVYPDPKMRKLQEIYENDDEKQYDELEFSEDDPLNHWWFGYIHARISEGPHHWTSMMFDEIGDIAPEAARNDDYAHYQKVELLKDCWVDARKYGLSIFAFGHSEADIHSMIRRKIRWRVTMNGTANPTNSGDVVGFSSVPMEDDIMSDRDVGDFLPFSEAEFQYPPLSPDYIPSPVDMTLKISFS
jgi:hypothetical protein